IAQSFSQTKKQELLSTVLALVWLAIGLVGCSTTRLFPEPVPNRRLGLFDRMGLMEPLNQSQGGDRLETVSSHIPSRKSRPQRSKGLSKKLSHLSGSFGWPLKSVEVTSFFGKRGREFHEGIDLR